VKIPPQGLIGREALREASADLRQVMALVRAAINEKVNPVGTPNAVGKWFDVEAFYVDRMVIELDGRCWSYPFTMEGTTVKLGEPQEVVESYEPVTTMKEAADLRVIEADAGSSGTTWEATLIRAGMSTGSKVFYTDAFLRESAPLFDGARIFVKGDVEHLKGAGKDVRQLVGWVDAPRFVEGATPDTGHTVAMIHLPGLPEETRTLLIEAAKAGRADLVGLSIDAAGSTKREQRGGKTVKVASRISKVNSVDLIVEPGAGGGLVRLVEAAATHQEDSDMGLKERMLEAVRAKNPAKAASIDLATVSDEELETAYREALATETKTTPAPEGMATLEDIRMIEARADARVAIAASTLPAAAKDKLQADFAGRKAFAKADVDAAIKGEREYLARFTESGHVRMQGIDVEITEPRHVVIGSMLDAFFDEKHKDHRSVQSFRECYREITGDTRVTGRLENCDPARLREAMGDSPFREALDSTSFANVLGDSITRRMVADYRDMGQYDVWRNLAQPVPVNDFRSNERTRYGGYGDLPAVAEGDPYGALTSPSDEKASYAVTKRGGTEEITLEMVRNDDVGAIRRIPTKLSRAAKRTLAKFVLDFIRTNPAIYDGVALFHANHGNLGSAALDAAGLAAGRLAMLKQTEPGSLERLGIGPKHLWVPADLAETAVNLFNRNTNLDKTFVQDLNLTINPVWYWTDANDWALTADYNDIPTIEIGFLDGNQEPELFVQDTPTVGSMFSHDKVTYKMRHIYGGNALEFRGFYKSVVA